MSDLLSSLPGDIPGLLRRGSPVVRLDRAGEQGTLHCKDRHGRWALIGGTEGDSGAARVDPLLLVLDLADATGRAHAAWWASERIPAERIGSRSTSVCSGTEWHEVQQAVWNQPMTPTQIDTLARLVLRLAGRSHV